MIKLPSLHLTYGVFHDIYVVLGQLLLVGYHCFLVFILGVQVPLSTVCNVTWVFLGLEVKHHCPEFFK